MKELDIGKVKHFWHERANEKKIEEMEVTHRDVWQRWLEIELIKEFLPAEARLLDIGCGTGYTTRQLTPHVKEIVGIDYDDNMIIRAKSELKAKSGIASRQIDFFVQDVMTLNSDSFGMFDIALTCRCLINLKSWDDQKKALNNITSVIKPGGYFLFIEGGQRGRQKLNEMRQQVGLASMPQVWHNIDFDEEELCAFLGSSYTIEKRLNMGVYDFVSRIVHPLFVNPDEPNYRSKLNEIAAKLNLTVSGFEDLSRVIFLVLKKNSD